MGKSAGVDNIPAELVQAGGEAMIDILTSAARFGRQKNGRPLGHNLYHTTTVTAYELVSLV